MTRPHTYKQQAKAARLALSIAAKGTPAAVLDTGETFEARPLHRAMSAVNVHPAWTITETFYPAS